MSEKQNQKKGINLLLVLVIIIVILVGILFIVKRNNQSSGKVKSNSNSSSSTSSNETEEDVVDEEGNRQVEKYVEQQSDGGKVNTSNKLKEEKTLDGLTISNISLREIGGITTLLADVKNNTGSATQQKTVKISILDEEGEEITDLTGIIDPMEANGQVQLNASVTADVSNAYDFTITSE